MRRILTKEEFVEEARKVHGDLYSYDDVNYINTCTLVKIHCNRCGQDFEQKPRNHLNGSGCYACNTRDHNIPRRLSMEEFLKRARKVHGDKYDYSQVTFNSTGDKICIKCNDCGNIFFQLLDNHLSGHGCSICAQKKERRVVD